MSIEETASLEHEILSPLIQRSISFLKDDLEIDVIYENIDIISPKK